MANPYISPVADVALTMVAESWHDRNEARYIAPKLPQVQVRGLRSQHSGITTYSLAARDNYLLKAGKGRSYRPGQDLRPARALGERSVTITLTNEANDPTPFPLPRDGQSSRFADYSSVIAQHLFELYSRRDQAVITAMANNTLFGDGAGGPASWSGTDVLSLPDSDGTQTPIRDIDKYMLTLKPFTRRGDLRQVACADLLTLQTLASKPAYHGGGAGSGVSARLTNLEIVDRLKALHGFDEVWISDLPADTVFDGQTSAPSLMATTPFFWMGLVAEGNFDLTNMMPLSLPDGAIVMAQEFSPWVDRIEDPTTESLLYVGKDAFQAATPRAAFGRCITGNFQ